MSAAISSRSFVILPTTAGYVVLGDVTGHGLKAAMLVSFQSFGQQDDITVVHVTRNAAASEPIEGESAFVAR